MSDHYWASRQCSSKAPESTQPSEPKPGQSKHTFDSFQKDFEAFKAAVDRAVSRDPYGTLFGRRMARHPWITNPSWTPLSWLSQREDLPQDQGVQLTKPLSTEDEKPAQKDANSAMEAPTNISRGDKKNTTFAEEDYQYDPISMRKVPINKSETRGPVDPEPKKSFLETFFTEPGTDIPIKTYKSHSKSSQRTKDSLSGAKPVDVHGAFESCKKQEMRDLMARTKGNNLDTTALFTEAPLERRPEKDSAKLTVSEEARESPELDDNTPLFSGTTYAGRFGNEATSPSKSTVSTEEATGESSQGLSTITTNSPDEGMVKKPKSQLEPALDRIQAKSSEPTNGQPSKLQTAVDRHVSRSNELVRQAESGSEKQRSPEFPAASTEEDVDLLRASDVRAATRTARVTRQEREALKNEARTKLEADYASRQAEETNAEAFASNLTKKLNDVWSHVRQYPHGIVAKTMSSVNAFNDNYKKYVRPEGVKGLTDKLVFQDTSLSKLPSIYKDTRRQLEPAASTPSQEAMDADKERSERTAALKEATIKAKEEGEARNAQLSQLATDLRAAYENEYGPIDVNHRQPDLDATRVDTETQALPSKPHPLTTASVKPGVTTNSVIDDHVTKFEPKFVELVDGAKEIRNQLRQVDEELQRLRPSVSLSPDLHTVIDGTKEIRRELHEAHQAIRAIESGRPQTVWNALHKSCSEFGQKRIELKAAETSANKAGLTAPVDNVSPTEALLGQASSSRDVPAEQPQKVPEPFITPDGSPAWNDEQPPSIESLRKTRLGSEYIILAYDSSTGKVLFSPMNEPARTTNKAADAVGILSRLKNAPEFLKHFDVLKRAGYSLFNGNENMLIFKKKHPEYASGTPPTKATSVKAESGSASATASTGGESTISAATVSNAILADTEPTAATARPLGNGNVGGQTRVKRQEDVFSGTIRPNTAAQGSSGDENDKSSTSKPSINSGTEQRDGLWKRFRRSLKRTVMIVTALGGGAYVIGFIAEGMRAETQKQKGIEDGHAPGPRKRIVMTGQRPGIYSTESSR